MENKWRLYALKQIIEENIIVPQKNNKSLQLLKASSIKCDEFYTKLETAKKMIDPFVNYLKNKRIVCPCDTKESYIYIYIKSLGLDVVNLTEYHTDYSCYDVVITNHPWSQTKEFFEAIKGKKYLIIGNAIAPTSNHFKKWGKYWSKAFSTDWVNTNKKVNCRFYTNIKNIWKSEKGEWVKNGSIYTVACLDKTSRLDFILCNIIKNDSLTFKRFVFGKIPCTKYKHIANTGSFKRDYIKHCNGSVNVISLSSLEGSAI